MNNFRYDLYKIEQELGTTIKPIPQSIDKRLYVAEYQTGDFLKTDDDIRKSRDQSQIENDEKVES